MTEPNLQLSIGFDNADPAESNLYAQELRQLILDRAPRADVAAARTNADAMDIGTMVAVAVTNVVVKAVFEAIRVWMTMRRKPIRIQAGEKVFIIEQLTPEMQAEITQLLRPPLADKVTPG